MISGLLPRIPEWWAGIWRVCYDAFMFYGPAGTTTYGTRRVRKGMRCPKCGGNLMFEADVAESLLLHKCLQCGLIESYFWLENRTQRMIYLPPDTEEPDGS